MVSFHGQTFSHCIDWSADTMRCSIPHTKPFFNSMEANALLAVIGTRLVNEGDLARKIVDSIAQIVHGLGGAPTSTGSLGIHLALKTLGIEARDHEVIIPDFACRALYDSVGMAGATPVFCDINLEDYSLSIDSVRLQLRQNTRAIILPHMYGCPANLDSFLELGVPIIEDCAHSLGAAYHGSPVGSFASFSVFSFEGSKLIAAGEGGVVLANSPALLDKLKALRYGFDGNFAYPYRLSDLTAAVALAQLDKLASMIEKRRNIANMYYDKLKDLEQKELLRLPNRFQNRESVYYRFVVLCNESSAGLIDFANRRGVLIRNPLTSGCLSQTYNGFRADNHNAAILANKGASLPVYPDLDESDVAIVANTVHEFFQSESKR